MFVGGEVIVHGVVNKALERFTIDTYGFGLWQKLFLHARMPWRFMKPCCAIQIRIAMLF